MSIKLSTLMAGFEEFVEAVAVISAADAGSDATKIVDSALSIYGDTLFEEWWIYVTSGDAIGDIRQVETFDQETTTLTPFVNFSAAVASGDDYELHKHNPDSTKRAINDALVSLFADKKLYRKVVFNDLGHSLLTSNAAATPNKDVIVADATLFFVGQKLTISDDDGDSEDCTIASINTETNTLTMEDALANSYETTKNAEVYAKSGHYFNAGATLGEARITGIFIKLGDTAGRKPYTDWGVVRDSAGTKQIYFPTAISVDDKNWVIEAMGGFPVVSDPDEEVDIDTSKVKLLYSEVAFHLYDKQANLVATGDDTRLREIANSYKRRVEVDFKGLWMGKPRERISLTTDSDYD